MNAPKPSEIFGQRTREVAEPVVADVRKPDDSEIASDEAVMARTTDCDLGNPELPIAGYREQIVAAVDASQATVITAETGAGKSTQVPQFLAEAGYEVIVTQPRVVAARSVAERVRAEVVAEKGESYADFVGYRTARERGDNPDNQILFVTDGLQLVRELSGNGAGKKQALVLDEVHEWNENMEVLVAWAKQRMRDDPHFKVVTMSATMEADKLSHYFANDNEHNVPVIEVPGRTFEVKKSEGGDVADEAIKFARDGKNTLVFVPGKAEIDQVMAEVSRANIPGVTVLPLHGQLDKEEQRKVFKKYPGAKVIVATNVAQTSITIDDIDAVVDSGLERQNQVKNGVEGLYLNPISQADCLQRAGRAGRTKEGEYVLAQLGNNKLIPMAEREAYGTPEILRTRLDGMVLRLAKGGLDPSELEFYNVERQGEDVKKQFAADIVKAKQRLQKLGALREDGSITRVGRDMERMPVESHYGRMMIEARQYGPEVQTQLAAMLAVQEAGGICQFETRNKPCAERWRKLLASGMNDSDAIKQLEVFVAAERMSDKQKRDHDIYTRAFSKSREVLRQLRGVERLRDQDLTVPTKEQREQLVKCIIAGMVDNLYINDGYSYSHRNAEGDTREVSNRSIIRPSKMVVGTPFDLQVNTRRGLMTLSLLENPTNVPSVETLREVAPQLFSEKFDRYGFDAEGRVIEQREAYFNGARTGEMVTAESRATPERHNWLVEEVYNKASNLYQTVSELEQLQRRTSVELPTFGSAHAKQLLSYEIDSAVDTLDEAIARVPELTLQDIVPAQQIAAIRAASPDQFGGLTLTYKDGLPYGTIYDDAVLAWQGETTLPDGREIMVKTGWYGGYVPLSERKATLEADAKQRKQEEAERQRLVQEAEAARIEQERLAAEQHAREEAERLRQEEIVRLEAAEARRRAEAEAEAARLAAQEQERRDMQPGVSEDALAALAAKYAR